MNSEIENSILQKVEALVFIKLHNSAYKWIIKRGRAQKLFIIPEECYKVSYRVIGDVK